MPKSTVYDHFADWRDDGTWRVILDASRRQARAAGGHDPNPGVASIDSRTVKATEVADGRGYDGGEKVTGRKRHILVDKLGLLLVVVVSVASADDGAFAPGVPGRLTAGHQTRLKNVRADGKYRDHHLANRPVKTEAGYVVEVAGRPTGSRGSVEQARCYVVERMFAWLGRYRRKGRDYERFVESSEAMTKACPIHRVLRFIKPDKLKPPTPFKYRENAEIITG